MNVVNGLVFLVLSQVSLNLAVPALSIIKYLLLVNICAHSLKGLPSAVTNTLVLLMKKAVKQYTC